MNEATGDRPEDAAGGGGWNAQPDWLYEGWELTSTPPRSDQRLLANFGTRFAAFVVDAVIFGLLLVGTAHLYSWVGNDEDDGTLALVMMMLLFLGYSPLFTTMWGGTPGKRLCGLKVARLRDGHRVSYGRAVGRHLVHGLTFVIPLFALLDSLSSRHASFQQCFHDKAADTVVVRQQRRRVRRAAGPST
jgi:uncharacterized RDD family membrane protein YckC